MLCSCKVALEPTAFGIACILDNAYLIVDALDECTDLPQLLTFIAQNSALSSRVKWIVSSRNWPTIEETFESATQNVNLRLELNEASISTAVQHYTMYKVGQLKKYDTEHQRDIYDHLIANSGSTFLWVALVCEELVRHRVPQRHVRDKLRAFPPELRPLYKRMLENACNSDDASTCRQILAVVSLVFRPITLSELTSLMEMPDTVPQDDLETLEEIIKNCGSFLTLRDGIIYFVHQSAKDFLLKDASEQIFPLSRDEEHTTILSRSIEVMLRDLRQNIYGLRHPGVLIDQVCQPHPDPMASAGYSCIHWVDHLWESKCVGSFRDEGMIETFLKQSYLYWLEALSLLQSVPQGMGALARLQEKLQVCFGIYWKDFPWLICLQNWQDTSSLLELIRDMQRFLLYNQWAIENSPLQVYTSALVFSPNNSLTKKLFKYKEPEWIKTFPIIADEWSPCLQTLEGHSDWVRSVAFSGNSKLVASGSSDETVRIWDIEKWQCLQTLEGHSNWVQSVAFSGNLKLVASGSGDKTVRIWDIEKGQCLQTLDVGETLWDLSLDATGAYLDTEMGVFSLAISSSVPTLQPGQTETEVQSPQPHGYGISSDGHWITNGAENLLWLPSEYRPHVSATSGSRIAIGCLSGRVIFFRFNPILPDPGPYYSGRHTDL